MKLRTVKNVTIMEAGVQYTLSSGPATFTPEDLADAVVAANEDPSIPTPRLKLGHTDPRYNDDQQFDGNPAFGRASNLRLNENGMEVIADFVGVPEWLAEIMPAAFPSRSIEGHWNIPSHAGKHWRFVLTACSLLGVTWPGITQLDDLPLLQHMYGSEVPPGVEIAPELAGGDAMRLFAKRSAASANLDDIRRAFYNDFVPNRDEANWWWVRAVMTDPNQLVVEDDESGQLFMIDFLSDGKGSVSFGEPDPVRIEYVPDQRDAQKAASEHLAAALVTGREVVASWPSRVESRPEAKATGGVMGPKEVRDALGLPEDASEEQVHEALLAKAGITGETPPDPTPAPEITPVVEPTPAVELTPAPERQPVAASNLPPGTVLVDEQTWESMRAGLGRVDKMVEENDKSKRETLVMAAIADGRIPPARKDHWLTYLEKDMDGGVEVLSSLQPNIVPLEERGHARTADLVDNQAVDGDTVTRWSEQLFPEVRNRNAALASGQPVKRSRIQADAAGRG
jgi:hypothetical protein